MKLFPTKLILILACVFAWFFILAQNVLAIDNREIKLAKFLASHNSPLSAYSSEFIVQADKNGLDYRLLPAISGVESTFGRNYMPLTFNTYGWGGGLVYFSSWEDGISKVSQGLKENYVDKGAKDVEAISWIYCPPGNLSWAAKVRYFMDQIDQTEATLPKESPVLALTLTI